VPSQASTSSSVGVIPISGGRNETFIEGEERLQATLLPDCLEDYVPDENQVRVIEAFTGELDLQPVLTQARPAAA
jgi:hypothetical protein